MRSLITLVTALLLSTPALAADHEISFELGRLHNGDVTWDTFSNNDALPSYGLRGGFAFHDRLAVIAGWQNTRRGRDIMAFSPDEERLYIGRAAYIGNAFTLGLKADANLSEALIPYVTASGMLLHSTWKFDDDPDDENSIGQSSASATPFGFLTTAGVEIRIPQGRAPFTLGTYLEMGYGMVQTMCVNPYGDMQPKGFALRSGLGIRF